MSSREWHTLYWDLCFTYCHLPPSQSLLVQSLRSQVQESLQDEKKAQEAEIEDKPVTPLTALWCEFSLDV